MIEANYSVDFETGRFSNNLNNVYAFLIAYQKVNQIKKSNKISIKNYKLTEDSVNFLETQNSRKINNLFFEFLDSLIEENLYVDKINLWFNNSSNFDGEFIIDWLVNNNFKTYNFDTVKNNTFYCIADKKINWLVIKFIYKNKKFYVRDFFKFAMLSVEKMGVILNISKKQEFGSKYYTYFIDDFNKTELAEYIDYCKFDVLILSKFMNYFNEFAKFFTSKSLTISSYAKKQWEQLYKFDYCSFENKSFSIDKIFNLKNIYSNQELDKIYTRLHYFGGYTKRNNFWQDSVVFGRIRLYDLNSAYPAAMCEKMPVFINKKCNNKNCDCIKLYKIIIKKAELKNGLQGIIRCKERQNTFYKNVYKKFYYEVWDKEFDWFKKFYNNLDFEIKEIVHFYKKDIFKKFVEKFYSIKEDASKIIKKIEDENGNKFSKDYIEASFKKVLAKLMLNSLYGKFGQDYLRDNYMFFKEEYKKGDVIKVGKKEFFVNGKKLKMYGNYYVYNCFDNSFEPKMIANVFIASYITCLVRIKIYEQIYNLKNNFLYSDTDSVYCLDAELDKKFVDKTKLGYWDIEKTGHFFKCLGAKNYIFSETETIDKNSKIVIAGVNKTEQLFNTLIDTYSYNQSFYKNKKKTMQNGILIENGIHTIKEKNFLGVDYD